MTAAPELLPCPFCGGPAETRFWEWPYERYHVRCRKCHASAGGRLSFLSNAVEQWNTRTALARAPAPELIRAAVEAERERLQSDRPFIMGANHGYSTAMEQVVEEAQRFAEMYPQSSDGRNTFEIFADWARRMKDGPAFDAAIRGPKS